MKKLSQFLILLLMADAAFVCVGLARQAVMWKWIILYWAILTAKNVVDFMIGARNGTK